MLPKINRLKKKKDFERVSEKGRSFKEDFLVLRIVSNGLKINRFGFVVSKKISKLASQRNKTKRRLRELVRLKLPKVKKGVDGVLITCPGLGTKDFEEMGESINKLFKKAKILE